MVGFLGFILRSGVADLLIYPTDDYTRLTVYRRVSNMFDYTLHVPVPYK